MSKQTNKCSRNWTKAETIPICETLTDQLNNFKQVLEKKR